MKKKLKSKKTRWLKITTWIDEITDNGKNKKVVASLKKYLTMKIKDIKKSKLTIKNKERENIEEKLPEQDEDGIEIIS
jgi:transcriptional regulatory protein LevR